MTLKKLLKPGISIVSMLVLSSGILFLGSCCKPGGRFCHGSRQKKADFIVKMLTNDLNLTKTQKTKLDSIRKQIREKRDSHKPEMETFFKEIIAQVRADKIDQKKVNDLFIKKEAKMKEMRPFLVSKISEFHSVLSATQKEKLAKKLEKFHNMIIKCHSK